MADAAVDISSYKNVLKSDDATIWAKLAADLATPPEILCFLTEDPSVEVRRAVAGNPATPNAANVALSRDSDVTVRCLLARKLVGDGLDTAARQNLWRMGFTILETLMRDTLVQVRRTLAEGFSHAADAPHEIVSGLAFDKEEEVSGRVLSASPLLTDSQLIGYLKSGAPVWAQKAIAERPEVSPALGTETGAPPALAAFASNQKATIDAASLDRLVKRPSLGGSLSVSLARTVAAPLLDILCKRPDIDADTARRMNRAMETRKDDPKVRAVAATEVTAATRATSGAHGKSSDRNVTAKPLRNGEGPRDRAARPFKAGALTDDAIALALDASEQEFVVVALGLRAGLPESRVQRMVDVESPRTMVSLAWKAGLTARFAMDLLRQLAQIPYRRVINARDGVDSALSRNEMTEQLALFD